MHTGGVKARRAGTRFLPWKDVAACEKTCIFCRYCVAHSLRPLVCVFVLSPRIETKIGSGRASVSLGMIIAGFIPRERMARRVRDARKETGRERKEVFFRGFSFGSVFPSRSAYGGSDFGFCALFHTLSAFPWFAQGNTRGWVHPSRHGNGPFGHRNASVRRASVERPFHIGSK